LRLDRERDPPLEARIVLGHPPVLEARIVLGHPPVLAAVSSFPVA
jgi:hypothetical protein